MFYNKNVLPMIFIKNALRIISIIKYIAKYFYYENALQIIFAMKMHNIIFTIKMYCKWF